MKTVLFAAALIVSTMASANTQLQKGDLSTYQARVTLGPVGTRMPKNCPINALCESQGFATLVINLAGCVDRVAEVASNITADADGKMQINVSATVIATEQSRNTRCIVAPTKAVEIALPAFSASAEQVKLNDLSGK
jgi:hypothetical protein